ncbi:eukaryotic translation initiation factor 2-alpha kinase [Calliphora vicina]|uniref:eukaryotic translation initiation factor 2-alpha kinase n=1 Tax=Calliphora vicina TaxID=7373 RepID=UPI00325BE91F
MGIQHDLNVVRNYRKSLLHLTMLTSIVAAAAATATIEPPLTSSSSSTPPLKEGVPVAYPPPTESVNDNNGQLVANNRPAIPYCDESNEITIGRRLLYVTTLDGRLTALDITKSGKLRWSIPTGPGPLISSSIHRLELTNNGQFVRMIPSLSGGIYKFDGESIDPIPITTDNLLSSSAKFSDDLVISGGKETRTYGVSARTGQLLYECSMHGCVNSTDAEYQNRNATKTVDEDDEIIIEDEENIKDDLNGNGYMREHDPLIDDVIVVRRQTQTVRAVETRTGVERWNFSVGQHELDLIRPAECHDRKFSHMDMAILDLDIKVIVPEGVICAFSKIEPTVMLWKYKFDHPIVSAWKIGAADSLESIDMFGSAQWLSNRDDNVFEMPLPNINPSIYVGMYDRQLYIQESINLRKEIMDQSNLYTQLTSETRLPKIPWRPISAGSSSLIIYQHNDDQRIAGGSYSSNEIQGNELVPYDEDNFALSAQSVLNASEFVNGNGFYLYTSDELDNTNVDDICGSTNNKELPAIEDKKIDNTSTNNHTIDDDLGFSLDDIDAPIKVVILSIWFWWKELAIVAFTSALLLNILISQRNRGERQIVVIERHIPVPSGIEATESSTTALLGPVTNTTHTNSNSKSTVKAHRSLSESTSNSGDNFTSRFQSDFDLQRCLGRGGFGVVFEAKNKLDDCSYAIKRITLPNKEESRMRVMREVKTLANCEHQNIVRYFQSWVEKPPPGWQEVEDNKWLATEMSTSIQIDTPSDTHSTFPTPLHFDGNKIDKKKQLQSWMESMTSTACSSDHNCLSNGYGNYDEDDDDEDEDSCVIFRSESDSLAMRDNNNYDDEDSDSCVIFRSESQSRAMHDDDTTAESDITNKTKLDRNGVKKKSHNDAISIDIQTNSIELNLHRNRNIDYSQLSDSFQIEFVGSVNGDDQTPVGEDEEESSTPNKTKEIYNKKRRPQDLALDISFGENNNNIRNNLTAKPQQNKVYLYIQMQLCRKECLRDWLRDNKREDRLDFIASIFHQIVDAVDYVHYKGLIHRDLKPSNIFFSQEGQIKIGDFGLVTDMADIPNMITKCGDNTGLPSCARHTQQVGTHLYMSPEQLHGLPYDYKVDIYSLGLIFFELLVYFSTEMERIMTLKSLREGVYPKDFPSQHPKEHELLKKMLSSKPEERPATTELKIQLNEILKLPDLPGDSEAAALAAAARRLSRSRTFSSCE